MRNADGVVLPSYRGDIINDIAFTPEARMPDPHRHARGLSAIGGNAQSFPCLCQGRLCGPV